MGLRTLVYPLDVRVVNGQQLREGQEREGREWYDQTRAKCIQTNPQTRLTRLPKPACEARQCVGTNAQLHGQPGSSHANVRGKVEVHAPKSHHPNQETFGPNRSKIDLR